MARTARDFDSQRDSFVNQCGAQCYDKALNHLASAEVYTERHKVGLVTTAEFKQQTLPRGEQESWEQWRYWPHKYAS